MLSEKLDAESKKLTEEMEEYARNYQCKKCSMEYCDHMLKARAQKFRDRIDTEFIAITHMPRSVD